MADGDIWGAGRLSAKWLAVRSRLQVDVAAGDLWTQERSDLTGRAGAELIRWADRRPAFEALADLIASPDAGPVARQASRDDLVGRWGTVDAEIAVRAGIRTRVELSIDNERCVEDVFWECYSRTAIEYVEERVKASVGLEGAPSGLSQAQVSHFARQLARGNDVKVIAPRRKVAAKSSEEVVGMVIS